MARPSPSAQPVVVVGAVVRGALAGLAVVVPLSVLHAILDRADPEFADSGWAALFVIGLFAAYALAGATASRAAPGTPLANGILAGAGTVVAWLPVRVIIWVVRGEDRGLVTGRDPVLTPGQLFGQLLFAAALGALGAFVAAHRARTRRPTP